MTTPPQHPTDRRTEPDDAWRGSDPLGSDLSREFWGGSGDWSHEPSRPAERTMEHRGLAATVSRWWNSTGSIPATRVHGRPTTEVPVQPAADDRTIAELARSVDDDTDEFDLDDWLVDAWSADAAIATATEPARPDPRAVDGGIEGSEATVSSAGVNVSSAGVEAWIADDDWNDDDQHDDEWSDDAWAAPPPVVPRPMIDPLLARIGGLTVLLTLLVPAVLGFVGDSDDGDALRTTSEPSTAEPALTSTDPSAAAGDTVAGTAATPATAAGDAPPSEPATTSTNAASSDSTAAAAAVADGTESAAQQLTVDSCSTEYEVVAGDFWIRIADASGAPLADLLAVNSATIATPLYPGSTICLPAGATAPAPPSATTATGGGQSSATTTPAPPPTTAAPTTAAPTTTRPPLPPGSNATAAEVQAIIRDVWPDELEERALEIAWRESNFDPTAKNFCCYGVFQIYWSVHKSWLSGMGITAAEQLYDPTTNARAALALYQRAGGWGPWGG